MEALLDRLTAHASKRIRSLCWRGVGSDGVLPGGETPTSIVQTAFQNLLKGAKWDEGKDAAMVLMGIVDSRISNLVRSWENRNFCNPKESEEGDRSVFDLVPDEGLNPLELLVRAEDDEMALEILDALGDRTPEQRIASAIFGGARKRSEIAEEAQVSLSEYEASKKRLRTALKKFRQNRASGQQK